MNRLVCLLSVFLFCSIAKVSGQNLLSSEKRLKFGNFLFAEKDFLRAIDEYNSILKLSNNDTLRFKIAFANMEMGKYSEAMDHFKGLFFNSTLEDEAKYGHLNALFRKGDYALLRNSSKLELFKTEKFSSEVNKLNSISLLKEEIAIINPNLFFAPFDTTSDKTIIKLFNRKKNPEYKSPTKAAWLSALVPGLGKVYTGDYSDGATSFIVTGLMGYAAVTNLKAGHDFRGIVLSLLTAFFYGGNIYGSAAAAHLHNAKVDFEFARDCEFYLLEKRFYFPEFKFLR